MLYKIGVIKGLIILNKKIFSLCLLVIIQFFILDRPVYSEKNNESCIKFSNTVFVEYYSEVFFNDMRTKHKTIYDEPSFYLNEKFQVYFISNPGENKTDCLNYECVSNPPDSYISVNLLYTNHENFVKSAGAGLEFGEGEYKNPSFFAGLALVCMNDMVFNQSGNLSLNTYIQLGFRDDLHFYMDTNSRLFIEKELNYTE